MRSLLELSAHSAFHWWSAHCAARTVYCCYQMNWWAVERQVQMHVSIWGAVHLHSMDRRGPNGAGVQAPWHGVLETVWLHGDEIQQVGCLRGLEDFSLVWDAGIQSQFTRRCWCQDRITRRVWALRHQTGAQHSAVECTRPRLAVRRVVAPTPQPEPGSRLRNGTRDVNLLWNGLMCHDTWSTFPTLLRGI